MYWTILLVCFLVVDFLWLGTHFIVARIAVQIPDTLRYYPLSESGRTYYVRPWIGWFQDAGGLIMGSLFFLLGLTAFLKRDQIERRG